MILSKKAQLTYDTYMHTDETQGSFAARNYLNSVDDINVLKEIRDYMVVEKQKLKDKLDKYKH